MKTVSVSVPGVPDSLSLVLKCLQSQSHPGGIPVQGLFEEVEFAK